jgi:DNA-binding response OmpR family regulator
MRNGEMILVVEDEALIRMSLADHLETEGFEVVEAPTGDRAKELITHGTPITALITDVMMPGRIDGISLALWTRHNFPNIKILIVSGAAQGIVEQLGDEGKIVSKPYSHEAIVTRIRGLLGE